MDNNKPLCISQLLNGDSTLDAFNNESGERVCYKYPDETLSFQTSELQSILHDITNNSSFSNDERPCKYPVHTPVAKLAELNSVLSAGTHSEPCLTPRFSGNSKLYNSSCTSMSVEGSTENNFQHNSSYNKKSIYNLRDRSKINIKRTEKAVMHTESNVHINNTFPNVNHTKISRLRSLRRKSRQIKHSDIFESGFDTNKMFTEIIEVSNNSLKGLKNKETDSLNSTSNTGMDTACLRTNLSNNDSAYFRLLHSVIGTTKHNKTDHTFFEKDSEKIQVDVVNNISFIPELNLENFDMVKEDDNSLLSTDLVYSSINTNEVVTDKLFSGSECSCTGHADCKTAHTNSLTQNGVQSLFTRQSTEIEEPNLSVGLTSYVKNIDLSKINNFISHLENTKETVINVETERYEQCGQEKPRIPSRKKSVKNKRAQSKYSSANKENMQPFHPHCNNKIANNTNMKMSLNKSKPSANAWPPVNMVEDLSQDIEKGKITNHVTNTFEGEEFIIKIRSETQHSSHILTANNTNYSQTTNIIQNQVNCMHNKMLTINCGKSRNHLDGGEQTTKYCDSSASLITAISNAVVSEVSKPEESNSDDSHAFISEENKLKSHCFREDSVNHSVMSQADSSVNEEETITRQLSFSKTNNKMRTHNAKLSEDMCKAHYSTPSRKQKQLADLRKCLFNDSFLETEVENNKLKLDIRFSELHENRRILMNTENLPINFVDTLNNNRNEQEIANSKQMKKSKRKRNKRVEWKTKDLTKYVITKLHPNHRIKSNLICKKLMQFLSKKITETVENDFDFHVPVNEIKKELARWNIIKTNMDFYLFVLKYFRPYEEDFIYKSVPCIQTCGRQNLVPRPPKGHLSERILY